MGNNNILFEAGRKSARFLPDRLKRFIRQHINFSDYYEELSLAAKASNLPERSDFGSQFRLGITRELNGYHNSYLQACNDLQVDYQVVDISSENWIDEVRESNCHGLLVWPTSSRSIWRHMFDYRVRYIAESLQIAVYPSLAELDIYENKLRLHDWLAMNDLPHVNTVILFEHQAALDFVGQADYPIVIKSSIGASGSGVEICRSQREAIKCVNNLFGKGLVPDRFHPGDRQWGYLIAQEYIPDVKEWRMVRIGDSFFGYRKLEDGDYHSGSRRWSFEEPDGELLDLLREVTERFSFRSMAMDIFQDELNGLYINEMQTVFGTSNHEDQLCIDGQPGRFVTDSGGWKFEAGRFCQNSCCNLRIKDFLQLLGP